MDTIFEKFGKFCTKAIFFTSEFGKIITRFSLYDALRKEKILDFGIGETSFFLRYRHSEFRESLVKVSSREVGLRLFFQESIHNYEAWLHIFEWSEYFVWRFNLKISVSIKHEINGFYHTFFPNFSHHGLIWSDSKRNNIFCLENIWKSIELYISSSNSCVKFMFRTSFLI